jgi:hypothetical protein
VAATPINASEIEQVAVKKGRGNLFMIAVDIFPRITPQQALGLITGQQSLGGFPVTILSVRQMILRLT